MREKNKKSTAMLAIAVDLRYLNTEMADKSAGIKIFCFRNALRSAY